MNIVGPLLLLGGAIFVVAKRCELLGLCGETGGDSGILDTSEMTGDEILDQVDAGNITPVPGGKLTGGKKGCCTCEARGEGGKIHCHRGDNNWFNPPAGSGGSNDFDMNLALAACNEGCGGSSSKSSSGSTTGAKAGVSSGASIPKKPKLNASGSVGSGAGAGGSRSSSSSSKPRTSSGGSSLGGGARVNAGASFYTYPRVRSYFVDPNYVRPFNLYHRIAN
jgi:hypothetical protein